LIKYIIANHQNILLAIPAKGGGISEQPLHHGLHDKEGSLYQLQTMPSGIKIKKGSISLTGLFKDAKNINLNIC